MSLTDQQQALPHSHRENMTTFESPLKLKSRESNAVMDAVEDVICGSVSASRNILFCATSTNPS